MGKQIKFISDGIEVTGYMAYPGRKAAALVILHEWWGLNEQIKATVDALAKGGFVTFAPDFYKGKVATTPEEAGQLMTDMFQNRLKEVEDIFRASISFLRNQTKVEPKKIGVTGFCCGGTLAMYLPSVFPDLVDAAVPFYGLPQLAPIKAENIKIPIFFILAEKDEFVNNDDVLELAKKVWRNGQELQIKIYPGAHHAFMNEKRPEVYHKEYAKDATKLMLGFFKTHLVEKAKKEKSKGKK
ncbi:MAG: dienelactone hydrolase family protein [Candidatus Calescibacterium sp.]|nr:dienelactone hydrolase family protein [Candidatus Calescibacterium sp.]MCX7734991.1 dienelactone hydrolase family protein [bacterium]MDW8087815.1 dienelactone hydrolase family protein [Candidatus Calescibacterium sp.]